MRLRRIRTIGLALAAFALPVGSVAVLQAGVAGASTANHVTAKFAFHNTADTFTGSSTCPRVSETTGTATLLGPASATCPTSGSSFGSLPSTSTTTFSIKSTPTHKTKQPQYKPSTRAILFPPGTLLFKLTYGSSGHCTIQNTTTFQLLGTRNKKKFTLLNKATSGNVSVTPTTGLCATIITLLATPGTFTVSLTYTLAL
jgi:hypothetical protein